MLFLERVGLGVFECASHRGSQKLECGDSTRPVCKTLLKWCLCGSDLASGKPARPSLESFCFVKVWVSKLIVLFQSRKFVCRREMEV